MTELQWNQLAILVWFILLVAAVLTAGCCDD
jgi:hypothetical protein